MVKQSKPFSKKIGLVTEPIVALKRTIKIKPNQKEKINLIIAVGENKEEIKKVIYDFAKKFHPTDTEESRMFNINSDIKTMAMVEITPEHITGKEGLELYKKRNK